MKTDKKQKGIQHIVTLHCRMHDGCLNLRGWMKESPSFRNHKASRSYKVSFGITQCIPELGPGQKSMHSEALIVESLDPGATGFNIYQAKLLSSLKMI